MSKVYVVHTHEPMEGSTILYVGTSVDDADKVAKEVEKKDRISVVDIAELNLNEMPEERDITLKVSKRELQEMIDALDREGNVTLSDHLRGGNEP